MLVESETKKYNLLELPKEINHPRCDARGVTNALSYNFSLFGQQTKRRLAEACGAVLTFMHRHAVATTWGRSDLASSDMMSLETNKRVWQVRLDPCRQRPSMGLYSHVWDRWGIFHAQPLILNDQRQAGAAIEGVVRHEELDITQLAVHTDFAMALAIVRRETRSSSWR